MLCFGRKLPGHTALAALLSLISIFWQYWWHIPWRFEGRPTKHTLHIVASFININTFRWIQHLKPQNNALRTRWYRMSLDWQNVFGLLEIAENTIFMIHLYNFDLLVKALPICNRDAVTHLWPKFIEFYSNFLRLLRSCFQAILTHSFH